ncbi:hypothetical protein BC940DRAFT_292755 [Gongronella butleri]|nr:hypothetical protein BC940DRAFT_292755 [Gongronella butleri]
MVPPAAAPLKLIYTTPNALLVKLAKLFSVSTLGISSVSTPALMYFWDSPAVQAAGVQESMFLAALACSAVSTGSLHYLLSPFISRIHLHTPKQSILDTTNSTRDAADASVLAPITPNTTISIDTTDILARTRTTTLQLRDLRPSTRSLLTWTCSPQYMAKHPHSKPGRFWLDRRAGYGDQTAMRQLMRVVQDQHQRL